MGFTELQVAFISWNKKHIWVGYCDHPVNNALLLWHKVKPYIFNQEVCLFLWVWGRIPSAKRKNHFKRCGGHAWLTLSASSWVMSGLAANKYFRGTQDLVIPATFPVYLKLKRETSLLLSVGAMSECIPQTHFWLYLLYCRLEIASSIDSFSEPHQILILS